MRSKCLLMLAAALWLSASAQAAVLRVVVIETPDAAAYMKALEQGKALMKTKGVPGTIRVWRARFAGDKTGTIVGANEFASLADVAKADAIMASDPELAAWAASLVKLRKIVSDSLYEEVNP